MNARAAGPTGIAAGTASWLGITVLLLGVLFAAYEGNELMRQLVFERAAPVDLDLPPAVCPPDELEEEGISVAECEQLVADARSYLVSRPGWFYLGQGALALLGTLLAIGSIAGGAMLVNGRGGATALSLLLLAGLTLVDAGHFIVAQMAGPILRGIHLPPALTWFFVHLALALACLAARPGAGARREAQSAAPGESMTAAVDTDHGAAAAYNRFEIAGHWFLVVGIFFLFVSSWWMLALPLPSDVFRFREFPFQLHKNLGITIMFLLIAMAVIRVLRRQARAAVPAETAAMRRLRIGGHAALYALILAVCITGYMSSSYSGWATTWWWAIELPYWGREDEELNQLYSDIHLWTCWALLLAMAAHIGAALLHAFRNDGVVRRILRW